MCWFQDNQSRLACVKIVLKILTRRLESKAEPYLGRDQYGFRRGYGTRDAIAAMRVLCDRSLEHNKVYVCYMDYEKAFDRVNWDKLMTVLKSIGVDRRDHRLIWNPYQGQSSSVQVGNNKWRTWDESRWTSRQYDMPTTRQWWRFKLSSNVA